MRRADDTLDYLSLLRLRLHCCQRCLYTLWYWLMEELAGMAERLGFSADSREDISRKTKAALALKKANQEFCGGGVPYGFQLSDDGVHLEVSGWDHQAAGAARVMRVSGWRCARSARRSPKLATRPGMASSGTLRLSSC